MGYSAGALRYKKPQPSRSSASSSGIAKPVAIAAGLLLLAGGGAYSFLREKPAEAPIVASAPPPPPRPASAPDEITTPDPRNVDPGELSPAVQHRARAFSPASRLLSIAASPVVGRGVDLSAPDAQVVYTYYAPKQDPALAPNAKSGRFVVTVVQGGALQAGFPAAPGDAKAVVDEPLCVFSAAIRAGRASGIPAEANLHAVYELDASFNRAIWKLTVPGQKEHTRYLDGQSCAVLIKREEPPKRPGKR